MDDLKDIAIAFVSLAAVALVIRYAGGVSNIANVGSAVFGNTLLTLEGRTGMPTLSGSIMSPML